MLLDVANLKAVARNGIESLGKFNWNSNLKNGIWLAEDTADRNNSPRDASIAAC